VHARCRCCHERKKKLRVGLGWAVDFGDYRDHKVGGLWTSLPKTAVHDAVSGQRDIDAQMC